MGYDKAKRNVFFHPISGIEDVKLMDNILMQVICFDPILKAKYLIMKITEH